MARNMRAVAALLALLAVSAVANVQASRALLQQTPAVGAQEITREDADMIDIICGFSDGVSVRTIQDTMYQNLTNGEFVGQLSKDDQAYPWAVPQLDDMAWLCNMMRDFNNEREVADESGKPFDLMWYGDSVLQCLRFHSSACDGAMDVYEKEWADKYRSAVWALGGETTQSLMWRILHGNSPDPDAKAIVLQVGAQDLMMASQSPETWELSMGQIADRVVSIADYLKNGTKDAQVLLMGLLPITGYNDKGKPTDSISPLYRKGIDLINDRLSQYGKAEKRVSYIGCIDEFTEGDDNLDINSKYFSSGSNVPTGRGFQYKITKCLNPFLKEYVGSKVEKDGEEEEKN